MKKQTIKLNESQLRKMIKENIKKVLKENIDNPETVSPQQVRFNWNITVPSKYAKKMYELENQLDSARWVASFERDEEPVEMQHLSIYPEKAGKINEGSTDLLRYETIKEFAQEDPSTLSDGELHNRIEYMLAYRWALRGRESVLDEYMEEANRRGIIN